MLVKLVDNKVSWAGLDVDWVKMELGTAVLPGARDSLLLDTIANLWMRLNQEEGSQGSTHLDGLASLWHTDTDVSQVHAVPFIIPVDLIITVWVTKILKVVVGTPGIIENVEMLTGVSTGTVNAVLARGADHSITAEQNRKCRNIERVDGGTLWKLSGDCSSCVLFTSVCDLIITHTGFIIMAGCTNLSFDIWKMRENNY